MNSIRKQQTSEEILKFDDEQQIVYGWASVVRDKAGNTVVDHQGDIIQPEELEKAAAGYVLNYRDTGERHDPSRRKKGKLTASIVFTEETKKALGIPEGILPDGWFVGYHIEDRDTWEKLKAGTYKMFSIEGEACRRPLGIENEQVQE